MINVTNVLDQFKVADFRAFVSNYSQGDLAYLNFFPGLYQPTLTFESLEANFGAKVAADIVGFDSRAPRKGRQMPQKVTGGIPKIEIARDKKESDINTYRQLVDAAARASNSTQIANRLIDFMYGDSGFVLDGVNAKLEWLAKRVASTGKIKLTLANNPGGVVTPVDVDFGIPSGNITSVGTDWDTTASATPIANIKTKQTAARAAGKILRYAITDQATFDRMVATADVQKFAASFAANALDLQQTPSLQTVNTALRNAGLPEFIIWDSYINIEDKEGNLTATTGWEDGNILFTVSNILGNTQHTTTADGYINIDESVKAENDFVLVKTYATQDPITVVTKGIAYAVPVLNAASDLYILKTQL